jgi:hypothetical protein
MKRWNKKKSKCERTRRKGRINKGKLTLKGKKNEKRAKIRQKRVLEE